LQAPISQHRDSAQRVHGSSVASLLESREDPGQAPGRAWARRQGDRSRPALGRGGHTIPVGDIPALPLADSSKL